MEVWRLPLQYILLHCSASESEKRVDPEFWSIWVDYRGGKADSCHQGQPSDPTPFETSIALFSEPKLQRLPENVTTQERYSQQIAAVQIRPNNRQKR